MAVNWRLTRLLVILIGSFVLLVACGNTATLTPGEQATLICAEECAARGQCGTLSDGTKVVLAQDSGPVVRGHNRFFIENVVVTVDETTERRLIGAQNGVRLPEATPFPHIFYRVTQAESVRTAWVSAWCITR
jgi:hypothetical protein